MTVLQQLIEVLKEMWKVLPGAFQQLCHISGWSHCFDQLNEPWIFFWVVQFGCQVERMDFKSFKAKRLIFTPLRPCGQRKIEKGLFVLLPVELYYAQQLDNLLTVGLKRINL